jgi:hypothetical protein
VPGYGGLGVLAACHWLLSEMCPWEMAKDLALRSARLCNSGTAPTSAAATRSRTPPVPCSDHRDGSSERQDRDARAWQSSVTHSRRAVFVSMHGGQIGHQLNLFAIGSAPGPAR